MHCKIFLIISQALMNTDLNNRLNLFSINYRKNVDEINNSFWGTGNKITNNAFFATKVWISAPQICR